MWTASPRRLLLIAALLDVVGQLVVLWVLISLPILVGLSPADLSLEKQWGWLMGSVTTYVLSSWLFGSYTVLRWRRVPLPSLLPRVFVAAMATREGSMDGTPRWSLPLSEAGRRSWSRTSRLSSGALGTGTSCRQAHARYW